ncbi:MAG: winged helix-turn-helix domain-containing protein [Verrucomicrobiota bacterium]
MLIQHCQCWFSIAFFRPARPRSARIFNQLTIARLAEPGDPSGKGRYCRLTRENAKGRILTALTKGGLSNAQIREITQMTRHQAWWIMKQLESEGVVETTGHERSGL